MTAKRGGARVAPAQSAASTRASVASSIDVGERRQVVGQPLDGQPAGQVLREQAERLRMLEVAQRVHLPLGVVAVRARAAASSSARHASQSGSGEQHARVEQLVEQQRMRVR